MHCALTSLLPSMYTPTYRFRWPRQPAIQTEAIHIFVGLQNAPKLKVAIVGSGLAGLSTAVELLDQGYEVDIFEQRPFIGGKVASFRDKDGNHIEMG